MEELKTPPPFDTRPRSRPEDLAAEYERYIRMTPQERDSELQKACRLAWSQWMQKPESERWRWPEPPDGALQILRRWTQEYRERAGRR